MNITIRELSKITQTHYKNLVDLTKARDELYFEKIRLKKDGSKRILHIPRRKLSIIQKRIYVKILKKIPLPNYIHSQQGHSHVMHAAQHQDNCITLAFDIENFFPSVKETSVKLALRNEGINYACANLISKLCCFKNGLPQGTSTSPSLATIVALKFDKRLLSLSKRLNAIYSRFSDDVAISGGLGIVRAKKVILKIIEEEKFSIKKSKSQIIRHGQIIVGKNNKLVGLRMGSKITVPREYYKQLRAMIHRYNKGTVRNLESDALRKKIQSKLGYALYVERVCGSTGKFTRLANEFAI